MVMVMVMVKGGYYGEEGNGLEVFFYTVPTNTLGWLLLLLQLVNGDNEDLTCQ